MWCHWVLTFLYVQMLSISCFDFAPSSPVSKIDQWSASSNQCASTLSFRWCSFRSTSFFIRNSAEFFQSDYSNSIPSDILSARQRSIRWAESNCPSTSHPCSTSYQFAALLTCHRKIKLSFHERAMTGSFIFWTSTCGPGQYHLNSHSPWTTCSPDFEWNYLMKLAVWAYWLHLSLSP